MDTHLPIKLITEAQVAEMLGVSTQSLRKNRLSNRIIPYLKIGASIRYDLEDVISFIKHNKQGVRETPRLKQTAN